MTDARIYNVPAHLSFLSSVARGAIDEVASDPMALADYTFLVPDRETGFALQQAFVEQMQGRPLIMPAIETPADVDDDELTLRVSASAALTEKFKSIPPAVTKLERQLLLANEVLKIEGIASSPQKALALSSELGKLLDDAQRHNVRLDKLERLVPAAFRKKWGETAEFLKIITDVWPKKLAELGKIDPETRRIAMLKMRADYWRETNHSAPVLALGFDDDAPAMTSFLRSVAGLKQGRVLLQGFDGELDTQSWAALEPTHPQYAYKNILTALGTKPEDVREWKATPAAGPAYARAPNLARTQQERQKLLRQTMLPAATASAAAPDIGAQALGGVDLIAATSPQEEARVIALKLRETLEQPGRTAAFVTEDRALARRVSASLRKWKIDVQDEAGLSLSETPVGIFLLATGAMAAEKWAPVPTLQALRHPLAALGEDKAAFSAKVSELENIAFHGPRPAPGAKGLRGEVAAAFNRVATYSKSSKAENLAASKQDVDSLIDRLDTAGKTFFARMAARKPVPFRDLLNAHIRFAEALAADDKAAGESRLWRGEDGARAARFLKTLRGVADAAPPVRGEEYVDVLRGLLQGVRVQDKHTSHPELRILSPAQARFLRPDVVILGGLNDKVWPPAMDENPWLSPEMIRSLGLPAPQAAIGTAARAFAQQASNPNVLLTRALRSDNAPTVASPLLARMMLALRNAGIEDKLEKKTRLLDIHVAMYTPAKVEPIAAPAPTPPVSARPKELPVTGVETLMRDPYSTYVKYVLKFRSKAPLDSSPGVAERGTFTHEALDNFVKKYPDELPPNALQELLKMGEEAFATRLDNPSVRAFWWPRFERIAQWFIGFEAARRQATRTVGTEVRGKMHIETEDGVFTLTAIADRIDRDENDRLMMIDYKTGGVPEQKAVELGFSPQLTLEALISFTGGFDGIDASDVGKLQYWKLSGGRPAADIKDVRGNVPDLVTQARAGIEALFKTFNDPNTPYLVTPRPEWAPRYNSARHLSRVDEWATVKPTNNKSPATQRKRRSAKP